MEYSLSVFFGIPGVIWFGQSSKTIVPLTIAKTNLPIICFLKALNAEYPVPFPVRYSHAIRYRQWECNIKWVFCSETWHCACALPHLLAQSSSAKMKGIFNAKGDSSSGQK